MEGAPNGTSITSNGFVLLLCREFEEFRARGLDSGLRSRLYDFVIGITDQSESATMQIGEGAKRVSLTVDANRFHERRRLLPRPDRTAGRFRLHTEDAVERLGFVQQIHRAVSASQFF